MDRRFHAHTDTHCSGAALLFLSSSILSANSRIRGRCHSFLSILVKIWGSGVSGKAGRKWPKKGFCGVFLSWFAWHEGGDFASFVILYPGGRREGGTSTVRATTPSLDLVLRWGCFEFYHSMLVVFLVWIWETQLHNPFLPRLLYDLSPNSGGRATFGTIPRCDGLTRRGSSHHAWFVAGLLNTKN